MMRQENPLSREVRTSQLVSSFELHNLVVDRSVQKIGRLEQIRHFQRIGEDRSGLFMPVLQRHRDHVINVVHEPLLEATALAADDFTRQLFFGSFAQ